MTDEDWEETHQRWVERWYLHADMITCQAKLQRLMRQVAAYEQQYPEGPSMDSEGIEVFGREGWGMLRGVGSVEDAST